MSLFPKKPNVTYQKTEDEISPIAGRRKERISLNKQNKNRKSEREKKVNETKAVLRR